MADRKLTDISEGTVLAAGDFTYLVDVSDTAGGAAGTSKKVQAKYWAQTNGYVATITGGGTVALGGYTATMPATGTLVTTGAAQTLTSKTLTSPTIGGTPALSGTASGNPTFSGNPVFSGTVNMEAEGKLQLAGAAGTAGLALLGVQNADTTDGTAAVGIGFSAGTGFTQKVGIAALRQTTFSRADMLFLVDNTADTSDVTVADEAMRLTRAGNLGIGTASPSTLLHVAGTVPSIMISDTDNGGDVQISASSPTGSMYLQADINDELASSAIIMHLDGAEEARLMAPGYLGLGVAAPQGILHAHDGVGGFLFSTVSIPSATPVTIIPNGTGDVTKSVLYQGLAKELAGHWAADSGYMVPGGATATFATPDGTLELSCEADGSVVATRISGTSWTLTVFLMWI